MKTFSRRVPKPLWIAVACVSLVSGEMTATHFNAATASETIEISDVLAIAKQNSRLPKTLRVTWRIEKGPTEAARRYKAKLAGQLTSAVKAEVVPKEQLDRVIRDTADLEQRVKHDKREYGDFDYWTDFTSFQNRAIRHPATGGPFGFTEPSQIPFPDQLPNFTEVTDSFGDILVLSYGPATIRNFRLWQASLGKRRLGTVRVDTPWFKECHPPLVMANDWGGKVHPIDDFYSMLQSRGGTVLDSVSHLGRPHLLVVSKDGTRTVRAFIDLDQGAIPSRIEEYPWQLKADELSGRGISDLDPKLIAQFVMTCDIQSKDSVQGRYFYPVSGQIRMMSMAASPADALSPAQPEVAVHELTTWKYKNVECDREMLEQDFRLAFPPGMVFIDQAANGTFLTGDTEGAVQRIADGDINFGRQFSPVRWLAGGTCLLALLFGIGYLTRSRWNRRFA